MCCYVFLPISGFLKPYYICPTHTHFIIDVITFCSQTAQLKKQYLLDRALKSVYEIPISPLLDKTSQNKHTL